MPKMSEKGKAVIKLDSVCKTYRMGGEDVNALKEVSLEVDRKEFVSVMGPSGSGKSTLLQMMGALDKPTSGEISIDGVPLSKLSEPDLARTRGSKIGFVFQVFNLYPTLTALENVELPMIIMEKSKEEVRERAHRLLHRVGLENREHHLPSQLSGGQRQRVAIARALSNDPSFILADEPTGNLDSKSGREIMDMFTELNKEGKTIVVVTHDQAISSHSERVMKIMDGKLVGG